MYQRISSETNIAFYIDLSQLTHLKIIFDCSSNETEDGSEDVLISESQYVHGTCNIRSGGLIMSLKIILTRLRVRRANENRTAMFEDHSHRVLCSIIS